MGSLGAVDVHPSNLEQLRAWDGAEGAYWAARAESFDRAVARYDAPFFAAAAIRPDDRVLDIGCGSGGTTREAARRAPHGGVVGVDLSSAMLDRARQAAELEGLANVRFVQADAQVYRFADRAFDAAISRTGAMFFADPVAAFTNVGHALRPGGRLALLVWQAPTANEWISEIMRTFSAGRQLPAPPAGAPGPFSLADTDRIRAILGAAGFVGVEARSHAEPMWFGHDALEAVDFIHGVAGWMLDGLDEAARSRALEDLRSSAMAHVTPVGVEFGSATWLVTARRPQPTADRQTGATSRL